MKSIVNLVITCMAVCSSHAHEFWIQPDVFHAEPNRVVPVRIFNGERFNGRQLERDEFHIDRFEVVINGERQRVMGRHGQPVSIARTGGAGLHQLVYQSVENSNVLSGEEFEAYLSEEHLPHISDMRRTLNESEMPGRELYVRCAKALVQVGEPDTTSVDTPIGLPLEIVVTSMGQQCSAAVFYEGAPLPDVRVVAANAADPDALVELRTDTQGAVTFAADVAGPWMLTALHMIRLDGVAEADWKSYWASTTFDVQTSRIMDDEPSNKRSDVPLGQPAD